MKLQEIIESIPDTSLAEIFVRRIESKHFKRDYLINVMKYNANTIETSKLALETLVGDEDDLYSLDDKELEEKYTLFFMCDTFAGYLGNEIVEEIKASPERIYNELVNVVNDDVIEKAREMFYNSHPSKNIPYLLEVGMLLGSMGFTRFDSIPTIHKYLGDLTYQMIKDSSMPLYYKINIPEVAPIVILASLGAFIGGFTGKYIAEKLKENQISEQIKNMSNEELRNYLRLP